MKKLLVDIHEKESLVPQHLERIGVPFLYANLPHGDYSIFERIIIERKTVHDFANSVKTKRLFKQMVDLSESCERPILLIEGSNLFEVKGVHKKGIMGALTLITVYYGIPTIFTSNPEETALFLYIVYKREISESGEVPSLFFKKKARNRDEEILRVVEAIPGIGPKFARNLITKFENLKSLFSASEDELKRVPGIGEMRAKRLREVFISKFGKKIEIFKDEEK
jgi:Fanconi anemia group M protein